MIEDKDLVLLGGSASSTVINGNLVFKNSDSSIKGLKILYKEGENVPYLNEYYTDFQLLKDAGITAIDSEITVKDCIIMPDPPLENCGKGIQIWNMSGSNLIVPLIEYNEIYNAETGIYLYSHSEGGPVTGEISNNLLQDNTYGIVLRMHQENPYIEDNIIDHTLSDGIHGIHLTYEDGDLYNQRLDNISNNTITGYDPEIYCDERDE